MVNEYRKQSKKEVVMERNVKAHELLSLVKMQNYRCRYTGVKLTPASASVDHTLPLCKGGSHEINNLAVVHHVINIAKGRLSESEFVQICHDVCVTCNLPS